MINKYSINTTQNVNIDLEIAGIGDRLIALLVDYVILGGIGVGMIVILSALATHEDLFIILMVVYGAVSFFFHFIMEWTMQGQSFGKKYRKIKVVHKSGREAGVFHYLIRNLIRPLDMFYGLGALVMFFNMKTQRIGDLAAGTVVVKLEKEATLAQTIAADLEDDYQPVFDKLNVLRLSEQDVELIKEVTNRHETRMNWDLVRLTAEKIRKKTDLNTNGMKNLSFLKQVVKDYNYHNLH